MAIPPRPHKKIPSLWAEGRDRFLILQTDVFIILIIETLVTANLSVIW